MAFHARQLYRILFRKSDTEWVSWQKLVADSKKDHDRGPGGYPLEMQLRSASEELLIKQIFTYVHDRQSKWNIVAHGEWELPLTYSVIGPVPSPPREFYVEDIRLPDEDVGRQMLISEALEENEKG
jgi:hypothetical protein